MARVFSSGDLIVDRRFCFAEALAEAGDLEAAIDVLNSAMSLTPEWAAGWFRLGEWREAAGDQPGAIAAWEKALLADPDDVLGAGLKRDLARAVPVNETMPIAFIEALFDQYAEEFEKSLLEKLDYRAPDLLVAALSGQRFARVMDLGCGTGLAGALLRPMSDWLEGIDISSQMLARAAAKGVYDRLTRADLSTLEIGAERYDLIVAADVFVYVGALERILGWCAGVLTETGTLAFTVEASDEPLILRESRRFAHSRAYLEGVLNDAGFSQVSIRKTDLRKDRGEMLAGYCVLARGLRARTRQDDDEGFALT
ncbi:MAG: methyltransferase domain-containing protein [Pararhodobacter sp.]